MQDAVEALRTALQAEVDVNGDEATDINAPTTFLYEEGLYPELFFVPYAWTITVSGRLCVHPYYKLRSHNEQM